MKVLLVGSGGREHALAWKLSQSPRLTDLLIAPGNGGTATLGRNVPVDAEDVDGLLALARSESVDLTVVGPEAPLVLGIVDRFGDAGLAIAGPGREAAALEGSTVFAKRFMQRHGIPTGTFEVFEEADEAERKLRSADCRYPVVVKADGLAAGKGVFVCPDRDEALAAVDRIMRQRSFGSAGDRLLLEEFLEGQEASFMVLTDGRTFLPLPASRDHKAVFDHDEGPNTGGMGAYSSDDILSRELERRIVQEVVQPTLRGMAEEGRPFAGVLYCGLMLTDAGPRVLEFNVRLGDPEAQVVLPRLDCDLLEVFEKLAGGDLKDLRVGTSPQCTACVVLASKGYPGAYQTGFEISGLELAAEVNGVVIFHSGTGLRDGRVLTRGGRVLAVTAQADSLLSAATSAYEAVNRIHFEGVHYRKDIAIRL